MGHITTEWAILVDADTTFSSQTLIYASHLSESSKYDFWQGRLVNPLSDVRGTYWFGPIVCMCDSNCLPNYHALLHYFDHQVFQGRGGLWRVSVLKKVGFDHRTVGEDINASYRAYFVYGHNGKLAPNLLFGERLPVDMSSLVKQRTRWINSHYERQVDISWMTRSKFISFIELLSLFEGTQMPFQSFSYRVAILVERFIGFYLFWFVLFQCGGDCDQSCIQMLLALVLAATPRVIILLLRHFWMWKVSIYKHTTLQLFLHPLCAYVFSQVERRCGVEGLHRWMWGEFRFSCTPRARSTPARLQDAPNAPYDNRK